MKKSVSCSIAAALSLAVACTAFAGNGAGQGAGSGNHGTGRRLSAPTKPVCDGTGPKGSTGTGQRPMDGRGRKLKQGANASQHVTPPPAEQATAPAN